MITTIFFWGLIESPKRILSLPKETARKLVKTDLFNRLFLQTIPNYKQNAGG